MKSQFRPFSLAIGLMVIAFIAPLTSPASQVPGVNVNVSNRNGAQSEIGIAVNPTDTQNIVAVSNNIADLSRLGLWYSTDGGATWTANFLDENEDGFGAGDSRFDPNVAFDSDGNVYVVYSTTGTGNRLLVARSTDGGQNFNQVTTVTTDAGSSNLHTPMVTTRAAAGADGVLVVWARVQAGGESIEAALSLDAGGTFPTVNTNINDGLQRTFLPWATADGSGDFQIVWEVNQGGGAGVILHDTLDSVTLADGANHQVTTVQLTDFAAATSKIPAQPDRGLFSVSTIDVNRSTGRLLVSYTDRPNTSSNDTDVYVRFSDDGGANWSPRTRVNDDATTTSQFLPRISLDQTTGTVCAMWYDARDDVSNNQQAHVYVASSTDGGGIWSANQQLTGAASDESTANPARDSNNYGEYFGLSAHDGVAYGGWTDARAANFTAGTNEEVYIARMAFAEPSCDANGPYVAECAGPTTDVQLDGSGSSDPNGDLLTFSWSGLFSGGVANGEMPTVSFGNLGNFSVGLEVSDGLLTAACSASVTIEDTTAPNIIAPANVTAECASPAGTAAALGTPVVSDICDASVAVSNDAPGLFPLGTTDVEWLATDDSGNTASAIQQVTIEDTVPPDLTVEVSPAAIWPPNHKLVTITATITVSDTCDANPTVRLVSITSNEADNGLGDGNAPNDIQGAEFGTDDREFQVRAERSGTGEGRVYTVTYEAVDGSGNATQRQAFVTVPKSQKKP